jgi:GxxExxY protein
MPIKIGRKAQTESLPDNKKRNRMDRINRMKRGVATMAMVLEELTGKILEACFEVANELGHGFLESVYVKALIVALRQKGLSVEPEVRLQVMFRGQPVGDFYADLIVERQVLVEIKAVKALIAEHQAQVINYLRATGIEVGLLVNFGTPKIEFKRLHR